MTDSRRAPGELGELTALGRISAELLHDLGNMVALISGRACLLRDAARRGEAPAEEAELLLDDCREMQQMMNDILRELTTPQRSPEIAFSPAEVTESELNRWIRSAPAIEARLEARLPHSVRVEGPSTLYTRALRNLVINASRFARSEIQITLTPWEDPGSGREWAVVSVEDDGPGIPGDLAEKLFQPLQRGSGEEGAGWGLGLSLVEWAARRLGGRVEADRSPRLGGARLRLFLPRARKFQTAGPRSSEALPARPSPVRGVLVALVEDEPKVRDIQARLLQRAGAGVLPVSLEAHSTPGSLARLLAESRADIVLMDINLGVLDGVEVLRELAQLSPELARRTIFLSGAALEPTRWGAPVLQKGQEWPVFLARLGETLAAMGLAGDAGDELHPERRRP